MSKKAKHQIIRDISSEKDLREMLKILLTKMGYQGVRITHSTQEDGKDLVFYSTDPKTGNKTYFAVVAKLGDIRAGSSGNTNLVVNIRTQLALAFGTPFPDPESQKDIYVNQIWVVNNGKCTPDACRQIVKFSQDKSDMYSRNTSFVDEGILIKYLDSFWQEFYSEQEPFIFDYSKILVDRFSKLNELKALGYSKEVKKVLDIFIEPTLIERKEENLNLAKGKSKIKYVSHTTEKLLDISNNVWINGQAGSGKSTIIRNMLLKILNRVQRDLDASLIPVYINFKDILINGGLATIREAMEKSFFEANEFGYEYDINKWLENGKIILFIDAFDEIPTKELREKAIEQINDFSRRYNNTKIIATSRPIEIEAITEKLPHFTAFELLPMNFKQIMAFLDRWFPSSTTAIKENMLEALRKTAFAGKLPKTPMVLTLLAILFEESYVKELPANLTELYDMFTELFVGKWDEYRNITSPFDYTIKENILMGLAEKMHKDGQDKISEEALFDFIDNYSNERSLKIVSKDVTDEIIDRSNLLFKDNRHYYGFKHQSFQEYFTSKKMRNLTEVPKIEELVLDPWWENVIFFYVGQKKDAPELLEKILKYDDPDNPLEIIHKYLNMGQLLQAAYLTTDRNKIEIISGSINKYCECLEKIIPQIAEKVKHKFSRPFLYLIFKYIFKKNYFSTTLMNALEKVYINYKDELIQPTATIPEKIRAYILAYTLACLGKEEILEEIATSSGKIDPLIAFMMDIDFSELGQEYDIKIPEKIIKKIKKRIISGGEVIRGDIRQLKSINKKKLK